MSLRLARMATTLLKNHHSKFLVAAPVLFGLAKYIFYVWCPFGENEKAFSNNLYYSFDALAWVFILLAVCSKSDWLLVAFSPLLVFVVVRFLFLVALCFTERYLHYLEFLNDTFLKTILIANLFSLFIGTVFIRRKLKLTYMDKSKKDRILSAIRTLVTAAGAFIAGKYLFGTVVDENIAVGITGAVISVASTAWGFVDKTVTQEMFQSTLRSIVATFGPLLVASGKITNQTVEFITLSISTLVPIAWSNSEATKNQNIAEGKTAIADLKGVDETKPELIKPAIQKPVYG